VSLEPNQNARGGAAADHGTTGTAAGGKRLRQSAITKTPAAFVESTARGA
jgi:hypothetical protein